MKTLIEEAYDALAENCEKFPHSEDYERINYKVHKLYDGLEATLNDTQKKLLEDLFFETSGLECEAGKTYFIRGFNYGVRIVTEAMK